MKKIFSCFFVVASLINTSSLLAHPHKVVNYFGITPDQKYGLPNNVGVYSSLTSKISSCISPYDKGKQTTLNGHRYFGVSFQIKSLSPPVITLDESRIFNEAGLQTSGGEAPHCSGTFDSSTMIYQDIVQVDSIPYSLTFKLVDDINYDFELTESEIITEKADIAFVLRGYNGTTEYNFPASFRSDAKRALKGLSELSFGKITSYRIFDGGIDPNGPDYYQSLEDIKTIDAALAGWPDSWAYFKERDSASGAILINPTDEEISVLESLRQWLVENKKGAREGWQETQLGAAHYGAWLNSKVLRYGGTASNSFLKGLPLPEGLDETNYKAIGVIFSSTDTYNTSGAQHICNYFGITKFDGQALEDSYKCFYSDYSNPYPEIITAESLAANNANTTIHEAIHALGHSGHDRDDSGDYFPYSVMNQGKVDQYPVWNRVFILNWLPESTITDDPMLVADTYGATDASAKYLLRLGPQSDFDCADAMGSVVTCHRYQERYNGNWVQYKTTYTEGGSTWRPVGVTFEPLNDPTDTKAPEIILVNGNAAETVKKEQEYFVKVSFDEQINLGKGYVVINDADGTQLGSYQTNRLPEISSEDLTFSGNSLTIRAYQVNGQDSSGFVINKDQYYSLVFSDGAITDRAGNSIDQRSYSFIDRSD